MLTIKTNLVNARKYEQYLKNSLNKEEYYCGPEVCAKWPGITGERLKFSKLIISEEEIRGLTENINPANGMRLRTREVSGQTESLKTKITDHSIV